MEKLNVRHYLDIYKVRQEMQEKGITNPSEKIKKFTTDFVEKLLKMEPDEEIILGEKSFFDSNRKLIIEIPEDNTLDFFITTMPESRKADYYLGYHEGSVYLDFNISKKNSINLIRISFDGFGCYSFQDKSISLNENDSQIFIDLIKEDKLQQVLLKYLVLKAIELNKENIPEAALKEYRLNTNNI